MNPNWRRSVEKEDNIWRAKYPYVDIPIISTPLTISEVKSIFTLPIDRITCLDHDFKMILVFKSLFKQRSLNCTFSFKSDSVSFKKCEKKVMTVSIRTGHYVSGKVK